MKISLYALGCRTNQAEIEELRQALSKRSGDIIFVGPKEAADIYVINSCSVTLGAERDTRRMFNFIKNRNKKAKIYALGCLRNKKPQNIDGYFKDWREFIKNSFLEKKFIDNKNDPRTAVDRVKSFIKIQDGCDYYCSFCITRIFRGKSRSYTPEAVIKKILKRQNKGYKEIILTGINILLYRSENIGFKKLIQKILNETKIERIRFGSLDPRLLTDETIKLWNNPRLMPHVHLSLQSASEKILQMMNRSSSLKRIEVAMSKWRELNSSFGFSCDMIVGFPGETEEDFCRSLDFLYKNDFFKVHAFPYSSRPGTAAADFKKQIAEKHKKERMRKMLALDGELREKFQKHLVGKKNSVLWEGKRDGFWYGHTENFLRIKKKSGKNLKNKIEIIKLQKDNFL